MIAELEGEREAKINVAEGEKQEVIKKSEGIRDKQVKEAEGIRRIAGAIESRGCSQAVNLSIAEQYVD